VRAEDTIGLEALERRECLDLLASQSVGRLAISPSEGPPLIFPVNYALVEGDIVFRTDPGAKLDGLRQAPVSFEVDSIDPVHHSGWSVLVRGVAYEATADEIGHAPVEPWTPGAKQHWVRLLAVEVTGRRIVLSPYHPEPRGYL
jgi:nitroimidazol reductase NimA-like FMN-containing flavoprotein (pyridoxamine 5'-phosphate oxidase superfamily)